MVEGEDVPAGQLVWGLAERSEEPLERPGVTTSSGRFRREMSELEQTLVDFDREKQIPNDSVAIKRQYGHLRTYFETRGVSLPDSLEP